MTFWHSEDGRSSEQTWPVQILGRGAPCTGVGCSESWTRSLWVAATGGFLTMMKPAPAESMSWVRNWAKHIYRCAFISLVIIITYIPKMRKLRDREDEKVAPGLTANGDHDTHLLSRCKELLDFPALRKLWAMWLALANEMRIGVTCVTLDESSRISTQFIMSLFPSAWRIWHVWHSLEAPTFNEFIKEEIKLY